MERDGPTIEPDSHASPLGDADFAGRSWATLRSPTFSIIAGIIAPIACFALQPVLLSDDSSMPPALRWTNEFWLFAYGFVGLEMLVLALWLGMGARLGAWSGLVAGALFAEAIGLVLLLFSLTGLVVIIGALGLVPFVTAVAYGANAVEACRDARGMAGSERLVCSVLLGALLAVGVPGAVQLGAAMTMGSAIRDVAAGKPGALAKLRACYRFGPAHSLVWSYWDERDPVRQQRLADAYRELTGDDVKFALAPLAD